MTIRLSEAVRNDMLDVITAAVDAGSAAGYVEIRSGLQPATADDVATGVVLATLTLAEPSFAAAASGSIVLDADPDIVATATATDEATWGRVYDSTGLAIFDGSVGSDFVLTSTTVTSGGDVTLTDGQIDFPAS